MLSEVITIGATVAEHHGKLRTLVSQLWSRLSKGHVRIVVIGSAGAGKTSLGKFLSGNPVDGDYAETRQLETYKLDSTASCSILVPPGQEDLRAATWADLARLVAGGESAIVLHVVCWGLTAIEPLRFNELEVFEPGMELRALVEAHAEHQRQLEVDTLAAFAKHLELAPTRLSLVTVVTKQDLWWDNRADVRAHYEQGAHAAVIAGLRAQIGAQRFTHKIWSAGLISKNLRDGAGDLLVPTAAGYDEPTRAWHARRLVEIICNEVEHG